MRPHSADKIHRAAEAAHYMKQSADTPTTCGFNGQIRRLLAQAADSNSGIPAWRVCKVRRMLANSE